MRHMAMVPSDMRIYHRGLVLRLLRDAGPMSRAEAARRCQLSPPTVGDIVADLLEDGFVTEVRPSSGRMRLRSVDIALAAESFEVIGVHIGKYRLRVATLDLLGRLVLDSEVTLDAGSAVDRVVGAIAEATSQLLGSAAVSGHRVLGLGVSVPGTVDQSGRQVEEAPALGWRNVPLGMTLEHATGLPTVVDYNVRAMALAEARYGCGRGVGDLLYVHVGRGVGVGVVVDGEAFHARLHGAPEFGHQQVVRNGERCGCGVTGCLETVISEPALLTRARAAAVPGSPLAEALDTRMAPLDALQDATAAGDNTAQAITDDFCRTLAAALASAVNLLTPEVVALGGALATASKDVLIGLRDELYARVCPAVRDGVRIERSLLGADSSVLGAGTAALDRVLYRANEPRQR